MEFDKKKVRFLCALIYLIISYKSVKIIARFIVISHA